MTIPTTVRVLFDTHAERLCLRWLAGWGGEGRIVGIGEEPGNGGTAALVGPLNLTHPHDIQVFSQRDAEYFASLTPERRAEIERQLLGSTPVMVIIADAQPVESTLLEAAEGKRVPVFTTPLSSEKVITYLRHYLSHLLAEHLTLHGVFMEVMGTGVLLSGSAGVGKSELALELITRGHRLIADDAPIFSRVAPDALMGNCPELLSDFLEVRGLGLLNIRAMFGDSGLRKSKFLQLIIHLELMDETKLEKIDRLYGSHQIRTFLEVEIPQITLPIAPGRNLAVLVEAAVRDHLLKINGYNAALDFIERQRRQIQTNEEGFHGPPYLPEFTPWMVRNNRSVPMP
ncbi:HPr kinase/phosphorylase [Gammaproteobacteria bacterium]